MLKRDKIFYELVREVSEFIDQTNTIIDSNFKDDTHFSVCYHLDKTEKGEEAFKTYWLEQEQPFIKDLIETSMDWVREYISKFEYYLNYTYFETGGDPNHVEAEFDLPDSVELFYSDLLPLEKRLQEEYFSRFGVEKSIHSVPTIKSRAVEKERVKVLLTAKEQAKLFYLLSSLNVIPGNGNCSTTAKLMLSILHDKESPSPGEYQHLRASMRGEISKETKEKLLKVFKAATDLLNTTDTLS